MVVFTSDWHLGARGCQIERLEPWLRGLATDRLVLVGDILDAWVMRQRVTWSPQHTAAVQRLWKFARTHPVVYCPGNHDDVLRPAIGVTLGSIVVADQWIHDGSDGRRYLVLHGDRFDPVIRGASWLAHLGSHAYDWLVWVNRRVYRHWSLSRRVKAHVKEAAQFIARFEQAACGYARDLGCDGVIAGHIHTPADRMVDGIRYLNCGDWVESCSWVEDAGGQLRVRWV